MTWGVTLRGEGLTARGEHTEEGVRRRGVPHADGVTRRKGSPEGEASHRGRRGLAGEAFFEGAGPCGGVGFRGRRRCPLRWRLLS